MQSPEQDMVQFGEGHATGLHDGGSMEGSADRVRYVPGQVAAVNGRGVTEHPEKIVTLHKKGQREFKLLLLDIAASLRSACSLRGEELRADKAPNEIAALIRLPPSL